MSMYEISLFTACKHTFYSGNVLYSDDNVVAEVPQPHQNVSSIKNVKTFFILVPPSGLQKCHTVSKKRCPTPSTGLTHIIVLAKLDSNTKSKLPIPRLLLRHSLDH